MVQTFQSPVGACTGFLGEVLDLFLNAKPKPPFPNQLYTQPITLSMQHQKAENGTETVHSSTLYSQLFSLTFPPFCSHLSHRSTPALGSWEKSICPPYIYIYIYIIYMRLCMYEFKLSKPYFGKRGHLLPGMVGKKGTYRGDWGLF